MISKILMQKTRDKQEDYVVELIKKQLPKGWTYINYCNGEEKQYFKNNPLKEFPNIFKQWEKMPTTSHQADLFRYYFLYINGGVVLDGDAMIYDNIENIIQDFSFFSVKSIMLNTLCNGIMGSSAKNPIIYSCLKNAYEITDISVFNNNYHLLCSYLYDTVMNNNYNFKIKLFNEYYHIVGESGKTVNDNNNIIFIHYYKYKIIPTNINLNNDDIIVDIGTSNIPIKIITLHRSFNNPIFKVKDHNFNDNFSFDFFYNHLIVKRIDASYGWGHSHKVQIIENK
jgi:mannosyltransferase OCH1-like enzyme